MSQIIRPSATKQEVMTYNKTGSTDLTNLPYTISGDSLVDLGSSNWTQLTEDKDHPSMSITSDYGVKFEKTGFYRIDSGLFLYGTAPMTSLSNVISQNRISKTAPDSTAAGYYPDPAPVPDVGYNRFDLSLNTGAVLGLDPDLNAVVKVDTAPMTVWFYVNISGTPSNAMIVRAGTASNHLSTMTITRLGDL